MPNASLLIARRPGEFDVTELHRIEDPDDFVLWIDDLAAHWRISGGRLIDSLQEWLTHRHRYLIASHYDDRGPVLLDHNDFKRLKVPVFALPAALSTDELAAQQDIYGLTATTTLIGKHPPRGPVASNRLADFSRSINRLAAHYGIETPITAGAIAAELGGKHPHYAGKQFGNVDIDGEVGESHPLIQWLTKVRGCYDPEAVQRSKHLVIDGRLCILALIALDPALASQVGPTTADLLDAECDLRPTLPVPPARQHVRFVPDYPVELTDDELGRRGVATALTNQLQTLVDQQPGRSFLVHIDGPWGAGKSTLLGFVREEVNRPEKATASLPGTRAAARGNPWLVVPFDAWRQSKAGQPWLTLMHAVRGAVGAVQPRVWGAPWFCLRERGRLINRWQWFALLAMAAAVTGIGWLVIGHADVTVSTWGDWAKVVGGLLPVLAARGSSRALPAGSCCLTPAAQLEPSSMPGQTPWRTLPGTSIGC